MLSRSRSTTASEPIAQEGIESGQPPLAGVPFVPFAASEIEQSIAAGSKPRRDSTGVARPSARADGRRATRN